MHDVITNARHRWPSAQFEVREGAVQGASAVSTMIRSLAELDADPSVDVIVFARGGGSLEDLLPFSDESLIRAVAAARTPVVSAIGHEQDTPLLDLVADLRASTPTDAGKRIVPDWAEESRRISDRRASLDRTMLTRLDQAATWLEQTRSRPVMADPAGLLPRLSAEVSAARHRAFRAVEQRHHHPGARPRPPARPGAGPVPPGHPRPRLRGGGRPDWRPRPGRRPAAPR